MVESELVIFLSIRMIEPTPPITANLKRDWTKDSVAGKSKVPKKH